MAPPVKIDQEILVLPSFTLECGETLKDVPIAYKTWGKLNERRDNVMIICHAFTGSSDVEDWCVLPFLLFSSSYIHSPSRIGSLFSCMDRARNFRVSFYCDGRIFNR